MTDALHLFQHLDDAWDDGLGEEFSRLSRAALAGEPAWFVTGSYLQASALRRRCLEEGRALFGIEFIDSRALRRRLCALYGLPSPSFGHETLCLILQNALGEDPVHASVAEHLLFALDEFAREEFDCEGRLEEVLALLQVPAVAWPTVARLNRSDYWRPRVDQRLRDLAEPGRAGCHLTAFGLSALEVREADLLAAAARSARSFRAWLPLPVSRAGTDFIVLERLEAALGLAHTVCPAAGTAQPFGWILEAWQGFPGGGGRVPTLVAAEGPKQEIPAVVTAVARALQGGETVAVVVPEFDPFGPQIVDALSAAGIAVADDVTRPSHGSRTKEIQRVLARLHGRERTLADLWRLLELVVARPSRLAALRRRLNRLFDERQTPHLDGIVPGLFPPEWGEAFLRLLAPWPARAAFEDLAASWQGLLDSANALRGLPDFSAFELGTSELEPLWHEIGDFLRGEPISRELFAEFLEKLLSQPVRVTAGAGRTARVCVTTARRALATAWDATVVTRCAAEGWPRLTPENPLLGEVAQDAIRQKYGLRWRGASDKRRAELEGYLHLLTHTRRHLAFTYHTVDAAGDPVVPNEVVTYLQSGLRVEPSRFHPGTKVPGAPPPALEVFSEVWTGRTAHDRPFDEYGLVFGPAAENPAPWSASALAGLLQQPATFAFEHVFRCEREWDREYARAFHSLVGKTAHAWMAEILGGGPDGLVPVRVMLGVALGELIPSEVCALLRRRLQTVTARAWAASDPSRRSLWWEAALREAEWCCGRFIEHVAGHLAEWPYAAAERTVRCGLPGPHPLELQGRFDLVLSTGPEIAGSDLLIIDFKSSDAAVSWATPAGLQLHGYAWLCEGLQARSHRLQVMQRRGVEEVGMAETVKARAAWRQHLSAMQQDRRFGLGGEDLGGRPVEEPLPIATVRFAAETLRQKRRLTFVSP